jgi:serine/threonine protein kinase
MEYAEGNCLSRFLSDLELPLPFEIFVSWSIQLAKGMDYLHSNNIIHCDLKCKNVLLNKKPVEYLDMIKLKLKIANISNYSLTGTPTHMSPETIKNTFTQKSDVNMIILVLSKVIINNIDLFYFLRYGHMQFVYGKCIIIKLLFMVWKLFKYFTKLVSKKKF